MQVEPNTDEYDKEFIALITDIEKRIKHLTKHDRLRVESWCKKLCQVTNNIEWKKNRNLHTICLMDMILNNRFEEPYSRFAPESSLPLLSKTLVKSRLSNKFWKCTEKIYEDANAVKSKQNEENQQIQSKDNKQLNVNEMKEEIKGQNSNNSNNNNKLNVMPQQKMKSKKKQEEINETESENEIQSLKKMIIQLQNEITERDVIIETKDKEISKLTNRIEELENELANVLIFDRQDPQ